MDATQRAVMATYHHVTSNDNVANHTFCPTRPDSWCKQNAAKAKVGAAVAEAVLKFNAGNAKASEDILRELTLNPSKPSHTCMTEKDRRRAVASAKKREAAGNLHQSLKKRHKALAPALLSKVILASAATHNSCLRALGIEALPCVAGVFASGSVNHLYGLGGFKDGQLVKKSDETMRVIRGDQIIWVNGTEPDLPAVSFLVRTLDAIISRCNNSKKGGLLRQYHINQRTKAMIACYPSCGTHYVKHVDNPNQDGRCITSIYYLNKDWDVQMQGGLLRMFPVGQSTKVANIAPIFDRMLFFWSDRRNPHEVLPAYSVRFAITVWYLDAEERQNALRRFQREPRGMPSSKSRTPGRAPCQEEGSAAQEVRGGAAPWANLQRFPRLERPEICEAWEPFWRSSHHESHWAPRVLPTVGSDGFAAHHFGSGVY
ncbi:hypothetical protein HPB49_003546 [Dermacentor silvarum]|uniref:Uncharacterized protein n=1 Tax=Dermacentor silvarum TaxID=543639 RepID=A0ACB8CDC6_DERSI|nr:hypothetical protein HPB49_003546 [Dermacentor silvarum]